MELAPIAKVEVLRDYVKREVRAPGTSDYSSLKYVNPFSTFEFTSQERFSLDLASVNIMPGEGGNGVDVVCFDIPSTKFWPHKRNTGYVTKESWHQSLGRFPGGLIKSVYGRPETISVEFLGNEDRLGLIPLMHKHLKNFTPAVSLDSVPLDFPKGPLEEARRVVIASPTVHATLHNLHSTDRQGSIFPNDPEKQGFLGRAMLFTEMRANSQKQVLIEARLGLAYTADSEGILRVNRGGWRKVSDDVNIWQLRYLTTLLNRFMARIANGDLQSWVENNGFPLRLASELMEHAGQEPNYPEVHRTLKSYQYCYGIDLLDEATGYTTSDPWVRKYSELIDQSAFQMKAENSTLAQP